MTTQKMCFVLEVGTEKGPAAEAPSWEDIPIAEGERVQVGEYGFWLRPARLVVYRHGEPVYMTTLNSLAALVRSHLELLKLLDKPIEPEIVASSDGTPDLDDRGGVMVWQVNVTDPAAVQWYVMGGGGLERAFLKVRAGDKVAHFELRIRWPGEAQVQRDGTLLAMATGPTDPRAWAARFYTETARRLLREWGPPQFEVGDRVAHLTTRGDQREAYWAHGVVRELADGARSRVRVAWDDPRGLSEWWAPDALRLCGQCPDGGTCHHSCRVGGPCFRADCCAPLSGVFPDDKWPAGAVCQDPRAPAPDAEWQVGVTKPGEVRWTSRGFGEWWARLRLPDPNPGLAGVELIAHENTGSAQVYLAVKGEPSKLVAQRTLDGDDRAPAPGSAMAWAFDRYLDVVADWTAKAKAGGRPEPQAVSPKRPTLMETLEELVPGLARRPEPQAVSPGRPAAGETEASSSHFVGKPKPARAEGPAQPANLAEATIFAAVYAASLHAASTTGPEVRGGDPNADAWAAVAEWRSRGAGGP